MTCNNIHGDRQQYLGCAPNTQMMSPCIKSLWPQDTSIAQYAVHPCILVRVQPIASRRFADLSVAWQNRWCAIIGQSLQVPSCLQVCVSGLTLPVCRWT